MKRALLALIAMVMAIFGWTGVAPTAAGAVAEVQCLAYAYDAPAPDTPNAGRVSERGPPASTERSITYDTVEIDLRRPPSCPEVGPAWPSAYDYSVGSAADVTAMPTTRHHPALARPPALEQSGVAANSVRSAAPSTFTRAEALSGRASQRTVNEITESMRVNGWQGAPIDVVELNGRRIVVDGHHRLAAARRARIDVQYQVVHPSTVIRSAMYTSIDDILRSTYSVGPDSCDDPPGNRRGLRATDGPMPGCAGHQIRGD